MFAKIVKFHSPGIAEKIEPHLSNVELDGDRLIFSKFDERAFECAVGLAGFDETAYDYIDETGRVCQSSTFSVEIMVELEYYYKFSSLEFLSRTYSSFNLLACSFTTQVNGVHEFPLVLNNQFIEFALMVQQEAKNPKVDIISTIESAFLQVNEGSLNFSLTITGEGRTHTVEFYPTTFSITWSM